MYVLKLVSEAKVSKNTGVSEATVEVSDKEKASEYITGSDVATKKKGISWILSYGCGCKKEEGRTLCKIHGRV